MLRWQPQRKGHQRRQRSRDRPRPAPSLLRFLPLLLCVALPGATAARPLQTSDVLYIAHVNDVHNRIEEAAASGAACQPAQAAAGLCVGGWARISTAVAAARAAAAAERAGFLFLDIGDEFDGTLWDVVTKGQATARLQNMVKPDAMTLGNHEFSFPAGTLAAYIRNLTAPMLGACNVNTSAEPLLEGLVKRWVVKTLGGRKVGVIGWLTPDTAFMQLNAGKLTFDDVIPSVRRCVADLRRAHPDVDYIIGMSHTGYTSDLETAKAVPELDIIIGGHSHTFLNTPNNTGPIFDSSKNATAADCVAKGACDRPSGPFPTLVQARLCPPAASGPAALAAAAVSRLVALASGRRGGGNFTGGCVTKSIPVVQAYYASKYMGLLKVDLASKRLVAARPLLLGGANSSSPVAKDPKVLAAIEEMAPPVRAMQAKVAGRLNVTLLAGNVGRQMETNYGDLMADLFREAARKLPGFEAKYGPVRIGWANGGGMRNDIPAGTVTYGQVLASMPYGNTMAVKAATGAQIREALANGISQLDINAGRFPQVSGLRYWHRGTRLLSAALLAPNGTTSPLLDGGSYLVASTSYVLSGGDDYKSFEAQPFLYPSGDTMDTLLTNALAAAMPKALPVPDPTSERRVVNCAAEYVDCGLAEIYGPCCRD